ncbi:DNA primase [Campylobacter hyointestinalis]|uniref:DNA primase n=1 Tax=Campylobacter hyointestinalis TaxID=198 RepID=UPI0004D6EE70|nr:DNA primase [Campylobacter hyointestinalis]ANE33325.1 DNA primase [Campylobacter hyointestinalis subsp. hyointestinalis LMG 9260]KEA44622.1 DNA primase [Campylobacter hyointestinalis subsp. hyointestinalis]QKF56494.1 DNA primase [Campylobacter hyointestinalis subsp. hyointestinalis]TWO29572.1 DNA primase [Campylobacter hyointestinalis]TXK46486.1 DNA primase [Campylobacter hyointestinalis]
MIESSSIENLKAIIDISDVIGSYIPLKKSGGNFVCVCPFHNDKNPSMSVSPSKGIFHCFACKAGGDAIKFIMDYEKLSYPEAVEKLANMYNFTLTYTQEQNSHKIDKKVLENLNLHYKSLLYKNQEALNYLYNRGINDAMIEIWELGWASENQNTLNLLQNENIDKEAALQTGAIKQNEHGIYASFINRITFPIYNHLGNLVGFGGRTISGNPAKYVNSPQSQIFDKSRLLYGYDKAKNEIYKKGEIIICEGYMDCIMLHKAGFNNAVAVLGVALTDKHIPLLKRGDIKVVLSFDSDDAGRGAAFKSARLLALNEIDGRVVLISGEKDPADMIVSGKANELKTMLSGGVELGEFYIKELILSKKPQTPLEISHTLEAVQEFTKNLKEVVANSYIPLVATMLSLDPSSFSLSAKGYRKTTANSANSLKSQPKKDLLELEILKNMLINPQILQIVKNECDESMFMTHKETYKAVVGSQNPNNPYIRELNLQGDLEVYKDFEPLKQAIKILKTNFCDKAIKTIASSNSQDKFEQIKKLQNIKKQLKGI